MKPVANFNSYFGYSFALWLTCNRSAKCKRARKNPWGMGTRSKGGNLEPEVVDLFHIITACFVQTVASSVELLQLNVRYCQLPHHSSQCLESQFNVISIMRFGRRPEIETCFKIRRTSGLCGSLQENARTVRPQKQLKNSYSSKLLG